MIIGFYIISGYFQAIIAELSSCDRNYMAHKAYNIHSLTLYRCLLTPDVEGEEMYEEERCKIISLNIPSE